MAAKKQFTNEQIIEAYKAAGSIWKAAKTLGACGQSVRGRLKALDYQIPIPGRKWEQDEIDELRALSQTCSIGEIGKRLARPYAAIACKLSELSISVHIHRPTKIPRGVGFDKVSVARHIRSLGAYKGKFAQYCRANSLSIETLAKAIQRDDPDWWDSYTRTHAKIPEAICIYCQRKFYPTSANQKSCSRKCQTHRRTDKSYFGGQRRNTVGLAQKTCQLCLREVQKGLSSHHVYGKENDTENRYLVALCAGCHNLVTILSGRGFKADEKSWEDLINYVLLRRSNGKSPGFFTTVDIEEASQEDQGGDISRAPRSHSSQVPIEHKPWSSGRGACQ